MTPSESATLLLSLAYFIPLALVWFVNKYPELLTKGQDAAGRGMAIGCTSILLLIVSALLALAAAIVVGVQHKHMALAWRIVGLLPLAGSLIAGLVIYINIVMAKSRREQRNYEEAMSIPAVLIVDDDDTRPYRLYDALRPSFPTPEITLRHPGALYWQQREWFPRIRVLCLSADAMLISEGQTGELTQDLLHAMSRMKPACPIILHASTQAAADTISAKLSSWSIHAVIIESDAWIKQHWQPHAVQMLKDELEKRPAPTEID